jgi:hypothetical protein
MFPKTVQQWMAVNYVPSEFALCAAKPFLEMHGTDALVVRSSVVTSKPMPSMACHIQGAAVSRDSYVPQHQKEHHDCSMPAPMPHMPKQHTKFDCVRGPVRYQTWCKHLNQEPNAEVQTMTETTAECMKMQVNLLAKPKRVMTLPVLSSCSQTPAKQNKTKPT